MNKNLVALFFVERSLGHGWTFNEELCFKTIEAMKEEEFWQLTCFCKRFNEKCICHYKHPSRSGESKNGRFKWEMDKSGITVGIRSSACSKDCNGVYQLRVVGRQLTKLSHCPCPNPPKLRHYQELAYFITEFGYLYGSSIKNDLLLDIIGLLNPRVDYDQFVPISDDDLFGSAKNQFELEKNR